MGEAEAPKLSDFDGLDWQAPPPGAEGRDCWSYSRAYYKRAREQGECGNDNARRALELLSKCCALRLVPESANEPFAVMVEIGDKRTASLDDLSSDEISVVRSLAPNAKDAELRARLADIVWVAERDYHKAQLAIEAYLDAAAELDKRGNWIEAKRRLERAMRISAQLGKGGASFLSKVVSQIEDILARHDPAIYERRLQPAHLMDLLLEFGQGDVANWAAFSESLAHRAEQRREWECAQWYWGQKAKWETRRGDEAASQAAKERQAELYVEIANDFLNRPTPDHLSASIQLFRAVEAMRQAGMAARAEQVHREMLKHQELSTSQMQAFSGETDISQFVQRSVQAVKDLPLLESLMRLAMMHASPALKTLRETAEAYAREFEFAALFSTQIIDNRGRVVAAKPARFPSDPESLQKVVEADMFEHANRWRAIAALAIIEPARIQITNDHRVRETDLLPLILHNPIVPQGREGIARRGLHAGLMGDFVVSTHLLIPQLEAGIRSLLNRNGVITTSLSQEGIQEEIDLGRLLAKPELIEILGEEIVFDLRGLLVERYGGNLRNRMAHGLMDTDEFFSPNAVYLWWLYLRLCCLPILARLTHGIG